MLTSVYPLCSRFAAAAALAGGLALAAVAQAQQVEEKLFRLPDGEQAWSYTFSKGQPHPVLPENWIFVVAGSGCAGLQTFLPAYFRGLEGESGLTRFFILQKRGIAPADDGKQCSDAFIRQDHWSVWLADQQAKWNAGADAVLNIHLTTPAPDGDVVISAETEGDKAREAEQALRTLNAELEARVSRTRTVRVPTSGNTGSNCVAVPPRLRNETSTSLVSAEPPNWRRSMSATTSPSALM